MASQKPLEGIQILRGLAALAVVFHHACLTVAGNGPSAGFLNSLGHLPEVGAAGVDVFFAISGFIMLYVAQNAFGQTGAAADFWRRRLWRIVPLYWIYTTVMVLLETRNYATKPGAFSALYLLKSYLFLPAFNPAELQMKVPAPVLGVGWTLWYEMFFYLLMGFWICFGTRRTLLPFLLACFTLCLPLGHWLTSENALGFFLAQPILFEFFFGAAVAYAFILGKRPGRTASAVLFAVSGALLLLTAFFPNPFPWSWRWVCWGLPAAMLVYAGAGWRPSPGVLTRGLLRLGDSSYSLYLQHALVMLVLGGLLKRGHLASVSPDLLILAACVVSIAGGWFSYTLLEAPLNRWIQTRILASRRPLAVRTSVEEVPGGVPIPVLPAPESPSTH